MSGIMQKAKEAVAATKDKLTGSSGDQHKDGASEIAGTPLDTGSADTSSVFTAGGNAGVGAPCGGTGTRPAANTDPAGLGPNPSYSDNQPAMAGSSTMAGTGTSGIMGANATGI